MSKVKLKNSLQESLYKISIGNPGALRVLMEIIEVDPPFSFLQVLRFDDLGIYGPRIWMVYKDIFRHKIVPLYFALKHSRLEKVIRRKKLVDVHFAKEWEYYKQEGR